MTDRQTSHWFPVLQIGLRWAEGSWGGLKGAEGGNLRTWWFFVTDTHIDILCIFRSWSSIKKMTHHLRHRNGHHHEQNWIRSVHWQLPQESILARPLPPSTPPTPTLATKQNRCYWNIFVNSFSTIFCPFPTYHLGKPRPKEGTVQMKFCQIILLL